MRRKSYELHVFIKENWLIYFYNIVTWNHIFVQRHTYNKKRIIIIDTLKVKIFSKYIQYIWNVS